MFKVKNNKAFEINTIIGSETIIEGKIKLEGSIRIDGKIYGEVDSTGDIFIGKEGYVEPSIKGKNIIIAGEVKGNLYTSGKVHIQPSGKLTGSATTEGIIIDDGGIFNGESIMVQSDTQPLANKKKAAIKTNNEVVNE
ncbi:bactofilin family protein [Tepidibacillus decaturensis]|uniref:Cell shape determination protein CcmA n=1 Tax=Tepidibacillus decaturensis TaxID=1413211 RepID=A0A135L739_9BACI|nr:polymer-forming cytoskeletal protein [Tepidibacillus decaturensis]KXG44749.1 hypothetical protein U473_12470 [Tepidibacillus decaturensis]